MPRIGRMTDGTASSDSETDAEPKARTALKDRVRIVIFEAHTPAGKAFDVGLIVCILLSVMAVLLVIVGIAQSWSLSLAILNLCLISAIMSLGRGATSST